MSIGAYLLLFGVSVFSADLFLLFFFLCWRLWRHRGLLKLRVLGLRHIITVHVARTAPCYDTTNGADHDIELVAIGFRCYDVGGSMPQFTAALGHVDGYLFRFVCWRFWVGYDVGWVTEPGRSFVFSSPFINKCLVVVLF